MSQSFENKVAFITGGTSGIGKSTAIAFAKAGAKVALTGRREEQGNAVVQEIKDAGGEAIFIQNDVVDEAQVKRAVEETIGFMKSLHPQGRFGQASEIADAVLWLSSDQSSFVSGVSLPVDGGFTAK